MVKKHFLLTICLATFLSVSGKVELPAVIGDNMVLQQDTKVNLWGKAAVGSTVEATVSWDSSARYSAKTGNDGMWLLQVSTPKASYTPQSITISDGERTVLNNILIGEVWFTAGQSNMEMPLNGFRNCPIDGSNEEIATSGEWSGRIRMATVPHAGNREVQEWVGGKWEVPSSETAPDMSATSWYFAKMLTRSLDVPVGIICCAWGGSRVEGWIPREKLLSYSDVNLEEELTKSWNGHGWHYHSPLVMYNGMLHPLRHYTIKGFLWYQGESNCGKEKDYADRLNSMVEIWRKEFSEDQANPLNDALPFFLTEIAPWGGYGGVDGESGALLREAQHDAGERVIKNSGCITINDLVKPWEVNQIHPAAKEEVGNRFAYMALNRTYGKKHIACDSPEYDHHVTDGSTLEVFFKYADEGISPWDDVRGFEIAGDDKNFKPATAKFNERHKSYILSSPDVPEPKHVRYCFRNFKTGNVINHRGLPLAPFRSDR